MKRNALEYDNSENDFGEEPDVFERIVRTRPQIDEETRKEGRKLNHRTKKKRDMEF